MESFILKPLMFTCVLLCFFQEMEGTLHNVGLKKPAVQSDTYSQASPAVDGNTNGNYRIGSCTHTTEFFSLDPWWQVDLEDFYLVEEIHVYNRLDCCGERLNDVYASVYDNSTGYRTFGFHAGGVGQMVKLLPQKSMSARWIRIHLKGSRILSLCEVKIMSRYTMKKIHFAGEQQGEKTKLSVKGAPVQVRVVVQCIQACSRTEKSYFMRLNNESPSSPHLECYCPI